MKWKQYQQLTTSQREEYLFRFDNKCPEWSFPVAMMAMIFMMQILLMFITYLIISIKEFDYLVPRVAEIFVTINKLMFVVWVMFFVSYIHFVIRLTIYHYKLRKFVRGCKDAEE